MPTTIGVTFTAMPSGDGDGNFIIEALQGDGSKPALPPLVGFRLKPGTSYDTAWQLAQDMQNHITGIIVEVVSASSGPKLHRKRRT